MASLDSRTICALTLSFIEFTDISIILDIPILRQVLGFALLTFLPGFLLIQILKLTKNRVEKLLFLIGLSISFLMFVPLAINFLYLSLGIPHPISVFPLITTISLILAGLSLVAYRTGALDFQINADDFKTLIDRSLSPPVLGAGLILVLGILGPLFMRFYFDTLLSLFSMFSIVIVVIVFV